MPPKKTAKKSTPTSKPTNPPTKNKITTFEDILANVPLPPPPVVNVPIGPKGHASNLDETQLEGLF